ncbi:hypothetical protein N7512_000122 [Penicillium capsulatum]|nr:hypothetical protein N7512_000122 [Penicillium capsulatum]
MPGDSRSRDRRREREYIRGHYDEGEVSSPGDSRGKYRFREEAYDSGNRTERDSDAYYEEQQRRRRERRERKRLRDEELAAADLGERRRERSKAKESPATSPVKKRDRERDRDGHRRRRESSRDIADAEARRQRRRDRERERERSRDVAAASSARKHRSTESSNSASRLLNADALARMDSEHEMDDVPVHSRDRERFTDHDERRRERRSRKKAALAGAGTAALGAELLQGQSRHKSGARVVSGAYLEEGRSPSMNMRRRGGGGAGMDEQWKNDLDSWVDSFDDRGPPRWQFWFSWSKKKRIVIGCLVLLLLLLVIIIPVAVTESKKKSDSDSNSSASSGPDNSNLDGISRDSIPVGLPQQLLGYMLTSFQEYAKGTVLDPFSWYSTEGFNVTFTNDTVGGLYLMGLNSTWDDSVRPNENVPPLDEPFPYGSQPIRGVNVGGWFVIEPWITPSFFSGYSASANVVDEWSLSEKLGSSAATTLEKHYANFITESDFAEIKDAGLDHVRIPYPYWAVTTYEGDPYVAKISWRYLLRAIEWCRKYGIRVKLDLHGVPGSQNGWTHSGRLGKIRWLNGDDGDLNAKRSLEIHDQLSTFFAQDRYKNVVTIYGLVNEPFMISLSVEKVLNWTQNAAEIVRKNGVNATLVLHDGFLNLDKWDKMFQDHPDNMYLDTHQYTTFNNGEIVLNHTAKVELICDSWRPMLKKINSTSSGWGPTICGEWSQADTDCAKYLNNVGRGTRWEGTYDTGSSTEYCPTADDGPSCSCTKANEEPSSFSDAYKKLLLIYAEAQMSAFETAQGWFYWTWRTEVAYQWSYRTAWKNGYMPKKAYSPTFKCGDDVPDFNGMGLPEYY